MFGADGAVGPLMLTGATVRGLDVGLTPVEKKEGTKRIILAVAFPAIIFALSKAMTDEPR